MKNLESKVVFVTGAAGGLGLETAKAFAKEGSTVIGADIDAKRLEGAESTLREIKPECRTFAVDLTSRDSVEDMAGKIVEGFGGVDIIVNAAGIVLVGDFLDSPPEKWKRVMEVNLLGQVHPIYFLLPSMIHRSNGNGGGHIVNIASAAGLFPITCLSAYTASKYATVGFSEVLSQEMREHGIKVTTVCPGAMNTPMLDSVQFDGGLSTLGNKLKKIGLSFRSYLTSPERLAALVVESVEKDKSGIVTTRGIKLTNFVFKYIPGLYTGLIKGARSSINRSKKKFGD